MGGTLYLNNGQRPNRTNTCVSGYVRTKPNYALSNFHEGPAKPGSIPVYGYDFADPEIGIVRFPTSEHYLHFQKLNEAGKEHYKSTWHEKTPKQVLDEVKKIPVHYQRYVPGPGGSLFDDAAWDQAIPSVQMQINAVKYQQSLEFKAAINEAIALGKVFNDGVGAATIIEDTSSAIFLEVKWGTGPAGAGKNILGNSQTAFANMVESMDSSGSQFPPRLPTQLYFSQSFTQAYLSTADSNYRTYFKPILQAVRGQASSGANVQNPQQLDKRDTSELGEDFVQVTTAQQIAAGSVTFVAADSAAAGAAAGVPARQPLQQQTQVSLVNRGINSRTGERFYYTPERNVTLVLHKDGGYHFTRKNPTDGKNIEIEPPLGIKVSILTAYQQLQQLQQLDQPSQQKLPLSLEYTDKNQTNGDRYYYNEGFGINLVIHGDNRGYHFSKKDPGGNRFTDVSPPPLMVEIGLLAEFQKLAMSTSPGAGSSYVSAQQALALAPQGAGLKAATPATPATPASAASAVDAPSLKPEHESLSKEIQPLRSGMGASAPQQLDPNFVVAVAANIPAACMYPVLTAAARNATPEEPAPAQDLHINRPG